MEYQIKRSTRRTIALEILPEGNLLVRCPYSMSPEQIDAFVTSKAPWIKKHIRKTEEKPEQFSTEQLRRLALEAKRTIPARVAFYAGKMSVCYGKITIRHQHTRWGSCASSGNLNFNCLLLLAPEHVLDYVVVHELCHRKHMNHSPKFWQEVEKVFPDYKVSKKWLKEQGRNLIARLPK